MSGAASQSAPGSTNFNDSGSLTFSVPLGGTFDLLVDYDLSTSGSGAGASSTSEVTSSLVPFEVAAYLSSISSLRPLTALNIAGGAITAEICAAGTGGAGARSALVRPDRLLRLVARNLGDGDGRSAG
jgi:hypothetical protein